MSIFVCPTMMICRYYFKLPGLKKINASLCLSVCDYEEELSYGDGGRLFIAKNSNNTNN